MNILMTLANPFTNDPRVYNEAKSLVKAGHDVTVLAWDNHKAYPKSETIDGINVVRSFNSILMNILPYDIFRLHLWWRKGYKDALKLYEKKPFDIVHSHDLSSLPIGVKLKKKLEIPLIYDAHEIWGYMIEKDIPYWWAKYYLYLENKLLIYPDHIITVNQPIKTYLEKKTSVPISIIMNCKPLQETSYIEPSNKIFTLLYIGVISASRYLFEIVEAVKSIEDVHFIIAGAGKKHNYVKRLEELCSSISKVDYIGLIPMEEVLPMTKQSDVVVCIFDPNNKNNQIGLPNKVFEAAVCGRPMIVTKNLFYEELVVKKEKFGLATEPTNDGIKNTIQKLKNNPDLCFKLGKNALAAAKKEYNWDIQEKKLIQVYKDVKK